MWFAHECGSYFFQCGMQLLQSGLFTGDRRRSVEWGVSVDFEGEFIKQGENPIESMCVGIIARRWWDCRGVCLPGGGEGEICSLVVFLSQAVSWAGVFHGPWEFVRQGYRHADKGESGDGEAMLRKLKLVRRKRMFQDPLYAE